MSHDQAHMDSLQKVEEIKIAEDEQAGNAYGTALVCPLPKGFYHDLAPLEQTRHNWSMM